MQMITRLFPSQCNVYSKGPVGDNCFHIALLLNTPSTLAIAKYLVKLYGKTLVNTPYQVSCWLLIWLIDVTFNDWQGYPQVFSCVPAAQICISSI